MYEPISPWTSLLLFVGSAIFALSLLFYFAVILTLGMILGAPGANPALVPLIGVAALAYPVTVVVGPIRVWRAHKRGDGPAAGMALAIPMAGAVVLFGLIGMASR